MNPDNVIAEFRQVLTSVYGNDHALVDDRIIKGLANAVFNEIKRGAVVSFNDVSTVISNVPGRSVTGTLQGGKIQ